MDRTTDVDPSTVNRPARLNWWIVAPLVWAVPATIAALQAVVTPALYATNGVSRRDWILAALQFCQYMLWAPLTPLIFATVRRFPFRGPELARSLPIHACVALLCSASVTALSAQLQFLMMFNRPGHGHSRCWSSPSAPSWAGCPSDW
jgi:hypothetical protein